MIIPGAEPFLLTGGTHGVLLIHGFTGSPAEMILLGRYLQSRGFTVHAVRLAGHATSEKDLARMTKEDWLNSALDGYSILKGCCDKVSIVGHSMGGLVSLNLAALSNVDIFRLVSLAAPIYIEESLGLKFLPPREKSAGYYAKKKRRNLKNVPPAVNLTYRNMPFLSVHELVDLMELTKAVMSKVKVPALILHGKEDHTAKPASAQYIFDNIGSEVKELKFIEDMGHLLPLREGREKVFELTAKWLDINAELRMQNAELV